jgi:hypothetical protein
MWSRVLSWFGWSEQAPEQQAEPQLAPQAAAAPVAPAAQVIVPATPEQQLQRDIALFGDALRLGQGERVVFSVLISFQVRCSMWTRREGTRGTVV